MKRLIIALCAILATSGPVWGQGIILQEIDGSPLINGVIRINVTNGTLANNGGGTATLTLTGVDLSTLTAWAVDVDYDAGDLVAHDSSSWLATADPTIADEPGVDPDWLEVVGPGPQGDPGDDGDDGNDSVITGTSTSTVTPSETTISLTTQAGIAWVADVTRLRFTEVGEPTNYGEGVVDDYTGTTVQIAVDVVGSGPGEASDWVIAVAGEPGTDGSNGTNGAGYGGTSSTSFTPSVTSQAITTGTGLAWQVNNIIRISSTTDADNYGQGTVSAYTSGTGAMTINITEVGDNAGSNDSWVLGPGASLPDSVSFTSVTVTNIIEDKAEADVASATTTDLGAENAQHLRITGTTTITGFGTVAAGVRRDLRFADALQLTHNGTSLILPTGANITTAAGDTLTTFSLGSGNWVVSDYQRASGAPLVAAGTGAIGPTELASTAVTPGSYTVTGLTVDADGRITAAASGTLVGQTGTQASPDTTGGAVTISGLSGQVVWTNTTTPYELPAASTWTGKVVVFQVTGTNAIAIDPDGSEVIVREGTAQTGGVTLTLTGAAGNFVSLMSDGTRIITFGFIGTLAAGS